MADNPYVNKVEYAGQTLMDLTGDTVTPSKVLNGETFHDRSGTPQQGSMITHNVYDGLDSTSADDALSAKQGKVLNDYIKTSTTEQYTCSSSVTTYQPSGGKAKLTRCGKIGILEIEAWSSANIPTSTSITFTVTGLKIVAGTCGATYSGYTIIAAACSPIPNTNNTQVSIRTFANDIPSGYQTIFRLTVILA